MRHFIRGFLDGDGSTGIYFYDKKIQRNADFICSDKKFLEDLSKYLEEQIGIIGCLGVKPPNKLTTIPCYVLQYSSLESCQKLFWFLYPGHNISMTRKYNKLYLCTLTPRELEELKSLLPCRDYGLNPSNEGIEHSHESPTSEDSSDDDIVRTSEKSEDLEDKELLG